MVEVHQSACEIGPALRGALLLLPDEPGSERRNYALFRAWLLFAGAAPHGNVDLF